MIKMIALWLVMGVGFYLLYLNGFLVMNSKKAVMYVDLEKGKRYELIVRFKAASGNYDLDWN